MLREPVFESEPEETCTKTWQSDVHLSELSRCPMPVGCPPTADLAVIATDVARHNDRRIWSTRYALSEKAK